MSHSPQRSLRHEYDLFVEREIEDYKDSISRSALLSIGDKAVAVLRAAEQVQFDELVLWDEVDRIIKKRLRIPSFSTWKRRRLKLLAEYRRPEHWGWRTDAPFVRAIRPDASAHILVAGANVEGSALYLAAHGCVVTAVEQEADIVERVMIAAEQVGLTRNVNGVVSGLDQWRPEHPLAAVVCSSAAFAGLSDEARAQAIDVLKSATLDGGVHLVETILAGQSALSLEEITRRYAGWSVSVELEDAACRTVLARKGVA